MAASKKIWVNLDVGHFFATGYDPIAYLKEHHARITNIHVKDRKKDRGAEMPFGEGDTPLKEVLQLVKKEKYDFPVCIEYVGPDGPAVEIEAMLRLLQGGTGVGGLRKTDASGQNIILIAALCAGAISGPLAAQTLPAAGPQPPAADAAAEACVPPIRSAHRPTPPSVERGRGLYGVNCAFCHGSDARGGEGGPNLIRSQMVLNDKNGEGITAVSRTDGRKAACPSSTSPRPRSPTSPRSFTDSGGRTRSGAATAPINIVVGDANAGEAFFDAKCGSCHSATGDLKGIAAKIADAKTLQQTWIMPKPAGADAAAQLP